LLKKIKGLKTASKPEFQLFLQMDLHSLPSAEFLQDFASQFDSQEFQPQTGVFALAHA
jgi:hypothetical protein